MPKLTSTQTYELARWFHDLAAELGDYRFANWSTLSEAERASLESQQWTLLNASSDFVDNAINLNLDEAEASFERLEEATDRAKKAVKKIKAVGDVLKIAAAAISLAGAIASKDLGAIGKSAKGLYDVVTDSTWAKESKAKKGKKD